MSWLSVLAPRAPDPPVPGPDGKPPSPPPPIEGRLAVGLLGAVLAGFLSNLDTRLTTFSLADLRGGLGYGIDEGAWITTTYVIAEVAIVPLTPWLSAILSPRRAIAAAVAVLTIAGAACPVAPNYTWLVLFRFLQGVGGGALIPLLLGTLLRFLPLHQRVWGFAFYALVTTFTPLISETISGVLTEHLGWQTIFWAGMLPGPLIMFMVLTGLPVEPMKPELFAKTDYAGMLLAVLFVSALTAGLDEGQRLDWFSSPLIVRLFIAAALFLGGFVLRELTTPAPLIDLALMLRRNFTGGLITIVTFAFATLATAFVVPQYGGEIHSYRELQVGNILLWVALVQVAMCPAAALALTRIDARIVLAVGLLLATVGSRLAALVTSEWIGPDILPSLLLQASSYPMIMVPLILIATSTLQAKDAQSGSALFNIARSLAGSLGTAVLGAILTVRERVHSAAIVEHVVAGASRTIERQSLEGLPAVAAAVRRQATTMAVADAFGWLAVLTLSTMIVVLFLRETRVARPPLLPAESR